MKDFKQVSNMIRSAVYKARSGGGVEGDKSGNRGAPENLGSDGNDNSPQNRGTRMVSAVGFGAGEGQEGCPGSLRLLAWASGRTPEPFSETRCPRR